jgi:phosphatidylethanolamine/phosphatidyl-N-methylethanolamine N-methyltransferase
VEDETRNYYDECYDELLNEGIIGWLKGFAHWFQEQKIPKTRNEKNILELGSGMGNHKEYVKKGYENYFQTDLRANFEKGIESADAESLVNFADSTIDRIIATCLIAHLTDPKRALTEWRRVVRDGGVISIYVPCEPGAALRSFRFLSSNIKAKRMGLNHYQFHYTEHRNHYLYLKYLFLECFKHDNVRISRFPFQFLSWNFNFFMIYTIQVRKNV